MIGRGERATAWTISCATHAAVAVALMLALGRGERRDTAPKLDRLVYVEPAPPRAAPVASVPVPSDVHRKDEEHRATAPAAPVPELRPRRRAPTRPVPPPLAPSVEAPPAPSGAGAPLGTTSGTPGGTVGGVGEAPLTLRDVTAPPELVTRVVPDYPPRARAMQVEGQVMVEIVLDRDGRVEDQVRVTRSIALLDAAAVAAVKQWRFRPARGADGRPVRVLMEIPIRFILR